VGNQISYVPKIAVFLPMSIGIFLLFVLSRTRGVKAITNAILIFGSILAFLVGILFFTSVHLKTGIIAVIAAIETILIFLEPYLGLLTYISFVYLRPQELDPSLLSLKLLSVVGIFSVGAWMVNVVSQRGRESLFKAPNDIFILMFLAVILFSGLLNGAGTIKDNLQNFLDKLIIHFLIVGSVLSVRRVKNFIWLLFGLSAVLAIQGIIQFHMGVGLGGQTMIEGRIRSIGFFADPNDLAQALVLLFPFLLMYMFERSSPLQKIPCAILSALFLYAIYLTNSRGGMLSLATVGMLFFRRKMGNLVGAIVAVVLIAALIVAGPSRMSTISADEASAEGRLDAWVSGLQMFKANPLFGVGIGQFTEYHRRVAHNSFVHGLAEIGFVGMFFWIGMIYMAFRYLHFVQKRTRMAGQSHAATGEMSAYTDEHTGTLPALSSLSSALQISLIGYLIAAFFLSRTYNLILFMLLALAVSLHHTAEKEIGKIDRVFGAFDVIAVVGIEIATIVFIYMSMRVL